MRKITKYFDLFALALLFSVVAVALFVSLSQDELLYKTETFVLIYLFISTAFFLFLILALPLAGLLLITKENSVNKLSRWFSALVFGLFLFGFSIHFLDNYVIETNSIAVFITICCAIFALVLFIGLRLSRNSEFSLRIIQLSRINIALVLMLFAFLTINAIFIEEKPVAQLKNQNVIIIVLDGLSTKYLTPYNPDADSPFFNEIAAESMLYTNIRTNFAFTSGYFYDLYSGRKNWVEHSSKGEKGLLSTLQEAGVNTRWFTFYNNGVPDSHNFLMIFIIWG